MKLSDLLSWVRLAVAADGGGAAPDGAGGDASDAAVSSLPIEELLADDHDEEDGVETPALAAPAAPAAPKVDGGAPPAAAAPAPVQPPAAPVAAPAAVQPPVVTPPVTPQPVVAPAAPVAPPQQPQPAVAPQPTAAEQAALQATKRAEFKASLTGLYRPGLETAADKIISEPAAVLSELAADLHMHVVESAINGILAQLPQVIAGITHANRVAEETENKFYGAWPQLAARKAEVAPIIQRFGMAYRQAHPAASADDFIREVGTMAMVAMRLTPDAPPSAPVVAPVAPVIPASFTPAAPGSGGLPPAQLRPPANEWEALHREFLEDD